MRLALLWNVFWARLVVMASMMPKEMPWECSLNLGAPAHHLKSASAWSLGQTVRRTPEHAKAVADIGVLPRLMEMPVAEYSSEDTEAGDKQRMERMQAANPR